MRRITPQEIKAIQLSMLFRFHAYCEKQKLSYFLYAGTLLGAVRHQGYIPWDDDVDVAMPRPDYERFLRLCKEEPVGEFLAVKDFRSCAGYHLPFAKIEDTRTDGYETYTKKNIRCGVWMDLFPIDGLPADEQEEVAHIRVLSEKAKLLQYSVRGLTPCKNPLRYAKRLLIYGKYHRLDTLRYAPELDALCRKYPYETSEKVGVVCLCGPHPAVVSRSVFEKTVTLLFEGMRLNAPAEYDLYLTRFYGDYMTPPPKNQRKGVHEYKGFWKDGFLPWPSPLGSVEP